MVSRASSLSLLLLECSVHTPLSRCWERRRGSEACASQHPQYPAIQRHHLASDTGHGLHTGAPADLIRTGVLCIILCFALGIANIFHANFVIAFSIVCLYVPTSTSTSTTRDPPH